MKHFFIVILLLTIVSSCAKNPEAYLEHLTGYWEIEKVVLADGTKREFKISQTIDYIFVTDSLNGFRKKLQPNFQGTYIGTKDDEQFTLSIDKGDLKIHYKTNLDTWTETIVFASKDKLIISNAANNHYHYKRYQQININ
jgi:hypothetical protein